jgi:hypothetical protein
MKKRTPRLSACSLPTKRGRVGDRFCQIAGRTTKGGLIKNEINPCLPMTQDASSVTSARICGAKTRFGPCQQACEPNRGRCRLHGGARGSGAPSGAKNGRFVGGNHTKEAKAERRWVRTVLGGVTEKVAMQDFSINGTRQRPCASAIVDKQGQRVAVEVYQSGGGRPVFCAATPWRDHERLAGQAE